MEIDVACVPFSRYGSYFAVSQEGATVEQDTGIVLRTMHGDAGIREICRIEAWHEGTPVAYAARATPTRLRLDATHGVVEMYLADTGTLHLRGTGLGIRLRFRSGPYATVIVHDARRIQINSMINRAQYMLTMSEGSITVDAPWVIDRCMHVSVTCQPDGETGRVTGSIAEFRAGWQGGDAQDNFDAGLRSVERDYGAWLGHTLSAPRDLAAARELAAYVNWASVVAPGGYLARPAMYMSKNWMTKVWSWDHCFTALALAAGAPDLAWDQFVTPFDHQDATGALPDSVNDRELIWNFCKPPIHGWTLARLMRHPACATPERLTALYEPLCRWTAWWFAYRDDDGDGIPQYNHGNDSGWDNATVFGDGMPVEGPDLSAFLILQMDVLAAVARRLGRGEDAAVWSGRADRLLDALLAHSWRDDHFVAPRSGSHTIASGDSLLPFLPLVLGPRLPASVRTPLVAGLTAPGRFLTDHGLATESVRSPSYEPDGYWRGPIWAPSTMLITDGLARAGEERWAHEISRRFCATVARSGMAENFNAVTGEGLRDPAYTWTSSVFLLLAHDYLLDET